MRVRVPGKPIALARHRHGHGRAFNPQGPLMKRYALLVKSLIKGARPFQIPLGVRLFFEYTPPRSWSKKKRKEAVGQPKTSTPDLSNLIKFTEDALNGILWEDDRLITAIVASKRYAESEGTVIEVFEIGETDENDL